MIHYIAELQLFVGYPKRCAIESFGSELPQLPADASLNELAPIWMTSVQCLLDDQRTGGRVLANILGEPSEETIEKVVGEVRFAGWGGDPCVALVISLFYTHTEHGTLMTKMTPELALRIADWVRERTAADWVVAVQPYKSIKVKSTAAGAAHP